MPYGFENKKIKKKSKWKMITINHFGIHAEFSILFCMCIPFRGLRYYNSFSIIAELVVGIIVV